MGKEMTEKMKGYRRVYPEMKFDEYYQRLPGLRKAISGIDGFVSYKDAQVEKVVAEFKGRGIERDGVVTEIVDPWYVMMMANWRKCKQIYDFDKSLYDELSVRPSDKIPTDILSKMPYPIIYVRCPHDEVFCDHPGIKERVHTDGALVSYVDGILAIRFFSTSTLTYTNQSTGTSVSEPSGLGIRAWGNTYEVGDYKTIADLVANEVAFDGNIFSYRNDAPLAVRPQADRLNNLAKNSWDRHGENDDIMHVLAALIYIVSKEADTESFYSPRRRKNRTLKDDGLSAAEVTRVGYRIGRALGEARFAIHEGGGAGAPRRISPHIRRAHWHCYWVGPKDNPTDIVVHWIAPILVNFGKGSEQRGVVHPARKRDETDEGERSKETREGRD